LSWMRMSPVKDFQDSERVVKRGSTSVQVDLPGACLGPAERVEKLSKTVLDRRLFGDKLRFYAVLDGAYYALIGGIS
jgi:hypothetical protein